MVDKERSGEEKKQKPLGAEDSEVRNKQVTGENQWENVEAKQKVRRKKSE